jgi:LCP family protein required for cell wall assembly
LPSGRRPAQWHEIEKEPTIDDQTPRPEPGPDASTELHGGKRKADKPKGDQRNFVARHKWLTGVVASLLALVLAAGGWLLYLNSQLGDINIFPGADSTLAEEDRPERPDNNSMNILIAGADNGENDGDGVSTEEALAAEEWQPGLLRSDTIMFVHIPANRKAAYLVSIPRDSYVTIYDENGDPQGEDKINAAFATYGPTGYTATVEQLTGLRMDHLAVIDWTGFKEISTALGGVEVYIPDAFYDSSQKIQWDQGYETLQGDTALAYVRTRYGLEEGDFDRIARQQNFLRAMMEKMLDQGVFSDLFTFKNMLQALVQNLSVDDGFSTGEIRGLVLSMRGLSSDDVTFLTAPLGTYDRTPSGASIVRLDERQSQALWDSIANDKMDKYLKRYGEEAGELQGDRAVD